MAAEEKSLAGGIFNNKADIGMVIGVIGILMAMIMPIPAFMLDFLLALNITTAIIVLITSMYAISPVEFSIFPSLLLILTLFRLSLNVASTRLILLYGNEGVDAAGSVIKSFGSFVVGGNYVIGFIVFLILVLINFIVITKGSTRIAEVAARFTLDGMPGKQMAIDADLNAGIIDEHEALRRREEIADEARFHGAMDGASKFVRGDAVAGIIITIINILGGFIIGVFQMDMNMATAAQNYTLLTVGDGLVTQIPALIISSSAGILVTRSAAAERMGKSYGRHFFRNPEPIYIGSGVVFLFGLVPGLPTIPFIGLALLLSGSVYVLGLRVQAEEEEEAASIEADTAAELPGPEDVEHLLALDTMEIEVGYGLIPLVDKEQDGTLLGRIRAIRRQFATEMGIVVPPIHIRDNLKLKPSQYSILIKGVEMAKIELLINHLLAMDPGTVIRKIDGIPTVEPAFNLPAVWIPAGKEDEAKMAGYTVVDNSTVIATHITEVIRTNAADLLGRQEVQHLLDNLAKTTPKAVEELVPSLLPLGSVQKVLQNLLRERISIRDLLTVVETLADYAPMSKDPELLTEYVRNKLVRTFIGPFVQADNSLSLISLSAEVEEFLTKGLKQTDQGTYLSVDPGILETIADSLKVEIEKQMTTNQQPIVLCSPVLRRHLRKIVEQFAPAAMVISHAELLSNVQVKSVGKVELKHGS
ncbi:MAG: flagellar biosynthesis protein FlhA [Desulfobacterales bacterium]|nr:flagellar biosynthesis protein FlhA [Desulfobacterales bacterium]